MDKQKIKVALCQRSSAGTKEQNLEATLAMIEQAVNECDDLDLIAFPEYNYYEPTGPQDAIEKAETIPGTYTEAVANLAKKYKVNIMPGSMAEKTNEERIRNTCPFINREGKIINSYSKIHLMDSLGFKESNFVEPGDEMCVFDADFGRVGLMVCYDLRFPELARSMVKQGADVILCPSCFPTGKPLPPRTDHWDVLTRSTALYNLTWVCSINQFGVVNGEHPFGRTNVIDPWGTVVAEASGREEIIYATLDLEYQQKIRDGVATWTNRRPDLYKL